MSDLTDAFAELQAMSPEQLEDLPEPGQSAHSIHQANNNNQ